MSRKTDPVDMVLDIIKVGIVIIVGYIIIKALLSVV